MLAAALLLAGCGGGSDDPRSGDQTDDPAGGSVGIVTDGPTGTSSGATSGSSPSVSLGPTSSATGAAFAGLEGQQIADTSKAAMLDLTSVRYRGTVAGAGDASALGNQISLDIQATATGDCTGTLGIAGGEVTVLATDGKNWFKGDRTFWEVAAGTSQGDQISEAVGDRWVLDTNHDFSQFCDLSQFLGNLLANTSGTTYATGPTSMVGGQEVVAVTRTATDDDPSTGYVATGPSHHLVRIERTTSGKEGKLDFSGFDQAVTVQAPDPADVVDPSALGSSSAPSSPPSSAPSSAP